MPEEIKAWLFDPTVGKFVTAAVVLLVVFSLVRLAQRSLSRYVQDVDNVTGRENLSRFSATSRRRGDCDGLQ